MRTENNIDDGTV